MGVETAVLLAGTAVSVYGQLKQADERASAEEKAARLKSIEAKEIMDRAAINEAAILGESQGMQDKQLSGFAAGNVDVTTGSPLLVMQSTANFYNREIINANRDAKYRANNSILEGASLEDSARSTRTASYYAAVGSIITGASKAGAFNSAKSAPEKMPGSSNGDPLYSSTSSSSSGNYMSEWTFTRWKRRSNTA